MEIGRYGRLRRDVTCDISACPAVEHIFAASADQYVVIAQAIELVVAAIAAKRVAGYVALDDITRGAARGVLDERERIALIEKGIGDVASCEFGAIPMQLGALLLGRGRPSSRLEIDR